jgi:zinc protease
VTLYRQTTALLVVLALAGATVLSTETQAPAQGAGLPPSRAVVRKGKAPVSKVALRVALPKPREAALANGLHLMVLEDRRVSQVTFTIQVPGGGGYGDPRHMPGLASFVAAMMREGTATRTSAQISEQLETLAATLTLAAGQSSTDATVTGSSLTEHFERLMDITADVLLNPAFADNELARYKQRTGAQLAQQRAAPGFLANELYARVVYGNHPAGRNAPTPASLQRVTRADLVRFHQTGYVPDHAVIAIAGDISFGEARQIVEARLGSWKKSGAAAPQVSDPEPPGSPAVNLVARPNSAQTSLIVATPAIHRTHPDYEIAAVMNQVIGGGPTSRLFLTLREERGYTYAAFSGLTAGPFKGDWRAVTDVRAEVTEPALRDLLNEIDRLRNERVPEPELGNAKRRIVASFALSLESPQQMLGYYMTSRVYKLPADYWERYPARILAVTSAQVQAVARKYLDPSRRQIVAVGDPKVADILQKFGALVTYDTEGQRAGSH